MAADKKRLRITIKEQEKEALDHLSEKYGQSKSQVIEYLIRKEVGFDVNITVSGSHVVQHAAKFIDTYVDLTSEDPLYWEEEEGRIFELIKKFDVSCLPGEHSVRNFHWLLIQLIYVYHEICIDHKQTSKIISERNERIKKILSM